MQIKPHAGALWPRRSTPVRHRATYHRPASVRGHEGELWMHHKPRKHASLALTFSKAIRRRYRQAQHILPRPGQSVDAHDRADPAMGVSATMSPSSSGRPTPPRLIVLSATDGRTLLRHQEQRPGAPSGRRPAHAGILRLATSEQGRPEVGEDPKLNADSSTEHEHPPKES